MRYIKDNVFSPVGMAELTITDSDNKNVEPHAATVGEVLKLVLNAYLPKPGQALNTPAEIRKFNKVMDILEAGPKDSVYAFEQEQFELLKRIVYWTLPQAFIPGNPPKPLWRSAPAIEDILEKAPEAMPVGG